MPNNKWKNKEPHTTRIIIQLIRLRLALGSRPIPTIGPLRPTKPINLPMAGIANVQRTTCYQSSMPNCVDNLSALTDSQPETNQNYQIIS